MPTTWTEAPYFMFSSWGESLLSFSKNTTRKSYHIHLFYTCMSPRLQSLFQGKLGKLHYFHALPFNIHNATKICFFGCDIFCFNKQLLLHKVVYLYLRHSDLLILANLLLQFTAVPLTQMLCARQFGVITSQKDFWARPPNSLRGTEN